MKLSTPAPNGWIGLPFGATSYPYSLARPHRGQDWGWRYANPDASRRVYSNCTGVVTRVHDGYTTGKTQNDGWGNGVEIQVARNVVSKLWHFNKGTIQVREGQSVTPETYIGPMGNSGWTNGETHLHEELWIDGVRVDPQYYRTRDIPGTGSTAGGDAKPFNTEKPKEWDEMASKEDIKAVVLEALASRPDAVLIHYSGAGRNGIYLAAPGYWHQFTAEQWTQFQNHGMRSGIRELTPVNDRDFDVFKEIHTLNQGVTASITDTQIATITKSVQDSLKNLSVDANVDEETITKIANAAVDRLIARAAD